jgi:hypothetical protein
LHHLGEAAKARDVLDQALTLAAQQGAPAWVARIQAWPSAHATMAS